MHPAGADSYVQPQHEMQQIETQLPPALDYLRQVDQLLIKQKKELIEMITDWESANKYVVLNSLGQQMFFAKEKSSTFQRQCCGSGREFNMQILDNNEQEVIHIFRPLKCTCFHQSCSCKKCCLDYVNVEAPPGRPIGKVQQVKDCSNAKYHIMDTSDQVVLQIRGPDYCKCHCPGDDITFIVLSADGSQEVGKVSKQWSNLMQEYFTDADNFGITFPVDLHVDMKATVMAACFLIDFMFFERSGNNN